MDEFFSHLVVALVAGVIGYRLDLGKQRILAHNAAADGFRRMLDERRFSQTEIDIFAQHLGFFRRKKFYEWIQKYKECSAQINDGDYGIPLYPKTRTADPEGAKLALEKLKDLTKHR